MSTPSTYIKLDRNILNWRWFKRATTLQVFIYLILNANIEPHGFEKITIGRGQLVASAVRIANDLELTNKTVGRILKDLEETGEISVKRIAHYRIITITNYSKYQDIPKRKAAGDLELFSNDTSNETSNYTSNYTSNETSNYTSNYTSNETSNNQRMERMERMERNNKGGSPQKATAEEQGKVIPERYRKDFSTWEEYDAWANQ